MNKLSDFLATAKGKIAATLGGVTGLAMLAPLAHAQTPTITQVDPAATQLLVNGVASIQDAIFSIAGLIWPYALTVLLFFLAIRFGMGWFHGGAKH